MVIFYSQMANEYISLSAYFIIIETIPFYGRTILECGFFICTILSPILMVSAIIKVISTKYLNKKWMWCILSCLGIFSFRMNWTTGEIDTSLLSVRLVGAGVTRGLAQSDAWFLTMTLPIGAMLILTGFWANPARARKLDRT